MIFLSRSNPRRSSGSAHAGVLLAVAVIALGGCDGSSVGETPQDEPSRWRLQDAPSAAPFVEVDIPARLTPKPSPIDAYLETPRQRATFDYATQLLAASCMRERGYAIEVPKFQDLVEWHGQQMAFEGARWFGITDRAEASIYGYGEPPMLMSPSPDLTASGASGAYRGQGRPDPDDPACRPQAEALLLDLSEVDYNASSLPQRLQIQAAERAMADSDYGVVFGDLGRCLRAKGYDIPDAEKPFASREMQKLMGGGMDRPTGKPAPTAEVTVALADITCKVKVDFVRRLEKIVSDEESQMIEENALALEEFQVRFLASLKRATLVVDGKELQ